MQPKVNIFDSIKILPSCRGGKVLVYENNRFSQYMGGPGINIVAYRCVKHTMRCRVKIKVDEKLKYAEKCGEHNHRPDTPSESLFTKPKVPVHTFRTIDTAESQFNKDVTNDVELITNDRDATVMFLKGYKYTNYYESNLHTRFVNDDISVFQTNFPLIPATVVSITRDSPLIALHVSSTIN